MRRIGLIGRLVAVCLTLLVVPAAAAPCLTPVLVQDWLERAAPAARIRVLAGEDARLFLAAYNALPPASAIEGDEVLLVSVPEEPRVARVALFARGCLARTGRMAAATVDALLARIARGGA